MKLRLCLPLLCLAVAGCATSPSAFKSQISGHFARPTKKAVYVEFMGDQQTLGLLEYARSAPDSEQMLGWKCTVCQPGATSADLLAAVPAVIALHPDVVHILTGDLEIVAPGTNRGQAVMANLNPMVSQLQAAKIPIVIGLVPTLRGYTPYYLNAGIMADYNGVIGDPPYISPVPVIDYDDPIRDADPQASMLTAKDFALMLPQTQAAIAGAEPSNTQ
jgi:hypothetical protein